jgi:N-methylhydantoinase A/oxoprolinase/acetone carboxylase beta subunit
MLGEAVDRMKTDAMDMPLIAVGGGSFLLPDRLPGTTEVLRPAHAAVANAVGAAIAQVSGEVDQVFESLSRAHALAEAERIARERAVNAGADPATLTLVDQEDLPIAYLPGNGLRVRARVVGEIAAG